MGDDQKWMYDGWRKNGAHSREWVDKINKFIKHAFSLSNTGIVRCPCSKCLNGLAHDKKNVSIHICRFGFMSGYEVWVHHGEKVPKNELVAEDDVTDEDRMDEMFNVLCPEFEAEDPPTPEVQKFFELLKASEEALHKHMTMYVLSFVTRLMAIKSEFAFSNNCYKEPLKLISDILPANHKLPRDMYQSKKLLAGLGMDYEKIDVCQDNCMLLWKEHINEKKCLKCVKSRFIEVKNADGEEVMMEIAYKQLRYMPLTPQLKRLFILKKTAMHMRWHKEGEHENNNVMVHLSDGEAWKALDNFDPDFARDARNVHIGLVIDGFTPFIESAASYSCWPVFAIPYNLPLALCIKYEHMFLFLIVPSLDNPGPQLNVKMQSLIEELK
jgi:hypothetical protein